MPDDFTELYSQFQAPINALDCGQKCAPYNERGVPFCCDTRHAVPTAYDAEWAYLQENTDLWHLWEPTDLTDKTDLLAETPAGMTLIECLGHQLCQRGFRAITCRQFPFFPYLDSRGEFLGLAYYWEYETVCWVISNLQAVTVVYREQFMAVFDRIFQLMSGERENYQFHGKWARSIYAEKRKALSLLHRNGYAYKITPKNERMRRVSIEKLPKFGPYKIAAAMPFPDELV